MLSDHHAPGHSRSALPSGQQANDKLSQVLLTVVDGGLAGVIFVAPYFMGGRHPLGELVLVLLSVTVALAWCARQICSGGAAWRRSGGEYLFAAAMVLVLLQLAHLPQAVFAALSSHAAEQLTLWSSAAPFSIGAWDQVSMNPDATRGGLAMLLAYGLLFLVSVQRIERIEDVERLVRWLAWSAAAMALFGIVQYLTSNGKFLWIYQHPERDTLDAVKGPFINKNHFAHLLALGIGPLVWCVARSMPSRAGGHFGRRGPASGQASTQLIVNVVALGITLFAGLMTLSRGGAAMMFLATLVSVAVLYRASLVSKKFIGCMASVFLLIGAALAIHGYQNVTDRLDDYANGLQDLDTDRGRRMIWAANLEAIPHYLLLGAGIGTHRDVYPTYFPHWIEGEFTHAENGYLQIALEAGLPGLLLLLCGIALCGRWCWGPLRSSGDQRLVACAAALTASLCVSVAHSAADFVWYISSCMAITLVAAACAFRVWQLSRGPEAAVAGAVPSTGRRHAFCAAALAVTVAGGWMLDNRFRATMAAPHWDQYKLAVRAARNAGKLLDADAAIVGHLEEVVRWTPGNAAAHLRLARQCVRRFDELQMTAVNPMPLAQVRDAAMVSIEAGQQWLAEHPEEGSAPVGFASRADLDEWMGRAVGEHRNFLDKALWHTRQGLSSCPLKGEGYLALAELCFLEGGTRESKMACIGQALAVRPYHGAVLLAAGSEAALARNPQDLDEAGLSEYIEGIVKFWRPVMRYPDHQRDLINLLVAQRVPPEFVLKYLAPDLQALRIMYQGYCDICSAEELRQLVSANYVAAHAAAEEASGTAAMYAWLEAHRCAVQLEDHPSATRCGQRAVACDENSFDAHFAFGSYLFARGECAEAEGHLKWCSLRQPSNKGLGEMLAAAVKGRIVAESTARGGGAASDSLRR